MRGWAYDLLWFSVGLAVLYAVFWAGYLWEMLRERWRR